MNDPINMIYEYNKEKGLLDAGYSDKRECAFPIEEALEGFGYLGHIARKIRAKDDSPKHISRAIVNEASFGEQPTVQIFDVDRFDKHLDIIVYSFGSLFKLGLSPEQVLDGLRIVMEANLQKSNEVDEAGKNIKGADWSPPEAKLQKILDENIKKVA